MANDLYSQSPQLSFLEQLRPFTVDENAFGRICADLHDLVNASTWLLQALAKTAGKTLSASELEDLLVEIDVHFIEHSLFHLSSLTNDIKATLEKFPSSDEK